MSDEGPDTSENFAETVSFSTLESRLEIPSFDVYSGDEKLRQWEADTWLRLEGHLLNDQDRVTPVEGGDRVFIFGPEKTPDGTRPIAVFNAITHEKLDGITEDGNEMTITGIQPRRAERVKPTETVIRVGDIVKIREFNPRTFQFMGSDTRLEVTSIIIRAGKA